MLRKGPISGGKREVTFELPGEVTELGVNVCGEFNDWSQTSLPMQRNAEGNYEVRVLLEAGRRYRYRYFIAGARWENDWLADDYVPNEFGGEDSAVDA